MKHKALITATAAIMALAAVTPAFAATTASSTRAANRATAQQERMAKAQDKGTKEIDARIDNLNSLVSRISQFKNISDVQKSAISGQVQGLINELTDLKNRIGSDTSTTSVKTDVQSITKDYRVYALVMPQLNIVAAADRVVTIASMLGQISTKLQTRLASETGILNMSSLQASLTDMNAKISDANTQAQAAITGISSLAPDQGDQTVMKSNTAALKDARSKIQAAQKDLVAARKDAQTIITALVKADKNIMKTATSTPVMGTSTTSTSSTGTSTATSTQ